jgi:prepilin-type N-terminal cleavage/methylation domain-containing protein
VFKVNGNTNLNGFSLIEVVSVLLLLSIVSIIIVPRLFDTGVDDAVTIDKLKTHLRHAQLRSMDSQVNWGVKFDAPSNAYWLFNTNLPNNEDTQITFPGEEESQVVLPNTMATPSLLISFDSLGRPFTDSGLLAPFTADLTLTLDGKTIKITKNTGYIP